MAAPYTRRDLARLALVAVPGVRLLSTPGSASAAESAKAGGKPNSKVRGVQIGLNVPYSFSSPAMSGDETLQKCVQLGISGVELRAQPVERFLGVPSDAIDSKDRAAGAEKMRAWRKTVSLDRVKPFRDKWDSAGVKIEILKVDGIFKMSEEELDYAFGMAKLLGARAISSEVTHDDGEPRARSRTTTAS
jgi:hypothetical protein